MSEPRLPEYGQPLSVEWAKSLQRWIRDEIAPRGDKQTTIVHGNVVTAIQQQESSAVSTALCVMTSVPALGYGPATAQNVTVTETGDVVPAGDPVPVIIPRLYKL